MWRAADGLSAGRPEDEIARELGRPPGAAAAMIERARTLRPDLAARQLRALLGGRAPPQARRRPPRRAVAADRGSVRGLIARAPGAAGRRRAPRRRRARVGGPAPRRDAAPGRRGRRRRAPARGHAARGLRRLSAPRVRPRRPRALSLRLLVSPVHRRPRSDAGAEPRPRGGLDARRLAHRRPRRDRSGARRARRPTGCARPGSTIPRSSWPPPTPTRARAPMRTRCSSACSPWIGSRRPCEIASSMASSGPPARPRRARARRASATGRADVTGIAESRVQGPLDTELGVLKVTTLEGRPGGARVELRHPRHRARPRQLPALRRPDGRREPSPRARARGARALRQRRGGRREPAAARLERRRDGGQRARRGRPVGLGRRAGGRRSAPRGRDGARDLAVSRALRAELPGRVDSIQCPAGAGGRPAVQRRARRAHARRDGVGDDPRRARDAPRPRREGGDAAALSATSSSPGSPTTTSGTS